MLHSEIEDLSLCSTIAARHYVLQLESKSAFHRHNYAMIDLGLLLEPLPKDKKFCLKENCQKQTFLILNIFLVMKYFNPGLQN